MDIWTEVFFVVISIVSTVVGGALVWFLTEKVGVERIRKANDLLEKINQEFFMKETWVKEAIRWAEQKFVNEIGSKKYEAVKDFILKKANESGIKITEDELDVLIESQLHKLKTELRDAWLGIIHEPEDADTELESDFEEMQPTESKASFSLKGTTNTSEEKIKGDDIRITKEIYTIIPNTTPREEFLKKPEGPQDGSDLNMMNNSENEDKK